ncbi:MAG: glycosyl transferase family 28 [Flavobacteriales bacterium]|nr:glycosyl transferase family 28 [Flavobacteriales bacterium]
MQQLFGARILVAPLDWGLGHAARCVPVVNALLEAGAVPVLGADGGPLALLREEFPGLAHVRIPGVPVRYARGKSQLWSMARQFPAMVHSVRAEKAQFDRLRQQLRLDAVISDQRFGIRSAELPSVLITHQVFPFTPFAQGALRQLNLRHITRFDRCWVMDEAASPGLAGALSHGPSLPTNARYIGAISRFAPEGASSQVPRHRIVAVISGPEPQRTLLEGILLGQLQGIEGRHLLVQGLPAQPVDRQNGNVRVVSHLTGEALRQTLLGADLIVSRSGYTTLMDLAAIGRSALIIPTPGQQEQEYLGRLHMRSGRFQVQEQGDIDLRAALSVDRGYAPATTASSLLVEALDDLSSLLAR